MKPLSAVLMCCALLPMAVTVSSAVPKECVPANKSADNSADGSKGCQEEKTKPRPRRAPPLLQDAPRPRQEPPRRESVPITPPTVSVPAPPPTITSCDGGGCWNANGGRYNGPAAPTAGSGSGAGSPPRGGAVTDSSGRLCTTNGAFVQCF
jgi:hypothetical protein